MKAVNTKGQSNYSNEITVTTKVDKIPAPEQVTFEPGSRTIAFSVGATCLPLVGVAEALAGAGWRVLDTVPLRLSGVSPTAQEAALEPASPRDPRPLADQNPRLRLKLCLQINQEVCSDYTEADSELFAYLNHIFFLNICLLDSHKALHSKFIYM